MIYTLATRPQAPKGVIRLSARLRQRYDSKPYRALVIFLSQHLLGCTLGEAARGIGKQSSNTLTLLAKLVEDDLVREFMNNGEKLYSLKPLEPGWIELIAAEQPLPPDTRVTASDRKQTEERARMQSTLKLLTFLAGQAEGQTRSTTQRGSGLSAGRFHVALTDALEQGFVEAGPQVLPLKGARYSITAAGLIERDRLAAELALLAAE